MIRYLFQRILGMVPTLLILMILSFWLASAAPGDPFSIKTFQGDRIGRTHLDQGSKALPIFYFSILSGSEKVQIQKPESWVPKIRWIGKENQFHHWACKAILGNWGNSVRYRLPVQQVIWKPLKVSFWISLLSSILFLGLAVLFGYALASQKPGWKRSIQFTILDMLYSLPTFWVAILSLTFLASTEFFSLFNLSPPSSPSNSALDNFSYFLLPILCLSIPSLAYYTKLISNNIEEEGQKNYVLQSVALGKSKNRVLWSDILKNALIPIITQLPVFFAGFIGGVIIIEYLFNIPGMGRLLVESFESRDYPVIFFVTFLTGLLSVVGFLLSDLLILSWSPEARKNLTRR